MPVNSIIVFYDGRKQYQSGRMPYFSIRKEINNAIGSVVYRARDNRTPHFGMPIPERDISHIINVIETQSNPSLGASFLNTYMLQYNKAEAGRSMPAAIKPEEDPDMSSLERQRQIKWKKTHKHYKPQT